MSETIVRITVPFPADMHREITDLAKNNDRSFNQQLLRLLREKIAQDRQYREDQQAREALAARQSPPS